MSALAPSRPIICLVTHGERILARSASATPRQVEDRLITQVTEAAAAGVDLVQVRELELEARDLCRLVERCLRAAEGSTTRIVVNDRADVALATGAHGVHLRADSYPAERVRAIAPASFLVGRSVHAPDEAAAAADSGAVDYIVFGTVFSSASKPPGHVTAGLDGLAAAAAAARPVPVLAIGGVSVGSARHLRAAGAAGMAAIGLFLPGEVGAGASVAETVRLLRSAFDTPTDLG